MARQLGRWSMTDAGPFAARPAAYLCSPLDALAKRAAAGDAVAPATKRPVRKPQHIHIHLPAQAKPRNQARVRTRDAVAVPSSPMAFPITDGDTFTVGGCGDGGFSLRRVRTGDTNPDGTPSPGDNVFGQSDPPGAASLDALRRKIRTRQVNDRSAPDGGMGQLRDMQNYLDAFYADK